MSLKSHSKKYLKPSTWVALSVKRLTSAQVMISQFMSLSPTLGSVLTVQNLLGILSLRLSLPLCPPK